jgi:hypothetical protein
LQIQSDFQDFIMDQFDLFLVDRGQSSQ